MKKLLLSLILVFSLVCPVFGAVDFDGTDGKIDCGDVSATEGASGLSVSAWVKSSNWTFAPNKWGGIVVKRKIGGQGPFVLGMHGDSDADADKIFYYCRMSDNSGGIARSNSVLTVDVQYHICGTWDGTTVKLFIDGVEQTTTGSVSGVTDSTTDQLRIGRALHVSGASYEGVVAGPVTDVAVWTTGLTTAEVLQLYKSKIKGMPYQIQPANLVAYWPLDDLPDGTSINTQTFKDRAGSNDGTGSDAGGESVGKSEEVLSYY